MNTAIELFAIFRMPLLYCAIFLCASCGILGLTNPELLKKINTLSAKSIDTERFFASLNTNVNTEQLLLKHARLFGFASLLTAMVMFYNFG